MQAILHAILESKRQRFTKPLSVKGSFLFLSDVEIPFHHAAFLNGAITLAKEYGVNQLVLGGDFCHFESFSPFPGADQDAETELSEIDEYLPGFLEPFRSVIWFMGNHDDRPQRALDRKISNEKALRLVLSEDNLDLFRERVTLSEYYWMRAANGWQLEHGKNNSVTPTGVAQAFVKKYHRHIIQAHTHKAGMVRVNGKWAIESGCGVDVKRLAYPNLRHSTHTEMQNGAVLMMDHGGEYNPILITPELMEFLLWQARRFSKPSQTLRKTERNVRRTA